LYTLSAKLKFFIPHAVSLKDKRAVSRSLLDKTQHRYNAAVAEVDTMDICQTLTIGIAVVSSDIGHARQSLSQIIRFMEAHAEAELIETFFQDERI